MPLNTIAKVSPTHEDIANFLLCHKGKGGVLAASLHFGYTKGWMGSIINSDAFQVFWRMRSDAHFGNISEKIVEETMSLGDRLSGVAHTSLNIIEEQLEKKGRLMEPKDVRDTAKLALDALGMNAGTTVNIQNNTVPVDITSIEGARERYRLHQEKMKELALEDIEDVGFLGSDSS